MPLIHPFTHQQQRPSIQGWPDHWEQFKVKCLVQGHFDMRGQLGIEPPTMWLVDDPLYVQIMVVLGQRIFDAMRGSRTPKLGIFSDFLSHNITGVRSLFFYHPVPKNQFKESHPVFVVFYFSRMAFTNSGDLLKHLRECISFVSWLHTRWRYRPHCVFSLLGQSFCNDTNEPEGGSRSSHKNGVGRFSNNLL